MEAGRRREGERTKNQEKYWHRNHKLKLLAKRSGTGLEKLEVSHWQRTSHAMTTFNSGVHHSNNKAAINDAFTH